MTFPACFLPPRDLAKAGFTLIEVLIATVIVGTVLTAIAATLTNTVKNSAESQYRTRATTLSQEAMEMFTREKSLDSADFMAFFPTTATAYCLETLPSAGQLSSLQTGTCGSGQVIDEPGVEFTRQATVTKSGTPPQVEVDITVSWRDGSLTPSVLLTRVYTNN